jgi:gamma-glutamylcyclotransferase (GGCT)/AIG2-like uncharacterized protein YtfP
MMNAPPSLPLFVYGTLLTDQPAFPLLAHAVERSAPAVVDGLTLYSVGRYPLALPGLGQIVGEVHWLRHDHDATLLVELDQYEGAEYTRQQWSARLVQPSQLVTVWVYVGDPRISVNLPPVPHGDWRAWLKQVNA